MLVRVCQLNSLDCVPFYGKLYLPRKFKITVAVHGDNSVDFYCDDINVAVIMDDQDPK